MKKIFISLCLGAMLAAGSALAPLFVQTVQAEEVATDTLLNLMQQTYAKTNTFRAEFEQELLHQESKTTQKRQGVILYQAPKNIRWESFAPDPELFIVTEKEIWNFLPDEELAYRYNPALAEDSRSLWAVITGKSRLNQDFDIERLPDENGLAHLYLFPKEPSTQMIEASLWLDPKTGLIKKVSIMDFYGNTNTLTFKTLSPNASVSADDFIFHGPNGIEIEDHFNDK